MNSKNHQLIESLTQSRIYKQYEHAFNEATGLPLALRPAETWQLPHHNRSKENDFCARMAGTSRSCASCLQVHQILTDRATEQPCTHTCPLGLSDSAVPVRLGDRIVGFLQTGQVFLKEPTPVDFEKTVAKLNEWGVRQDLDTLRESWFNTRVLTRLEYDSILHLLSVFAEHLSIVTHQILVRQEKAEPTVITRAKQYIKDHQEEELSLGQVAKSVNTSTFYFCKLFKKTTGLNYTDYVSRLRIEKAKNLLLNPNLRVSEIAYQVGFQSLTHFNRVFKRILGQSPTEYRQKLSNN